jgi:hypothetical protein
VVMMMMMIMIIIIIIMFEQDQVVKTRVTRDKHVRSSVIDVREKSL